MVLGDAWALVLPSGCQAIGTARCWSGIDCSWRSVGRCQKGAGLRPGSRQRMAVSYLRRSIPAGTGAPPGCWPRVGPRLAVGRRGAGRGVAGDGLSLGTRAIVAPPQAASFEEGGRWRLYRPDEAAIARPGRPLGPDFGPGLGLVVGNCPLALRAAITPCYSLPRALYVTVRAPQGSAEPLVNRSRTMKHSRTTSTSESKSATTPSANPLSGSREDRRIGRVRVLYINEHVAPKNKPETRRVHGRRSNAYPGRGLGAHSRRRRPACRVPLWRLAALASPCSGGLA